MTGGPRYWNEDSQRWEEADGDGAPGPGSGAPGEPAAGEGGPPAVVWPTPTVVSAGDPGTGPTAPGGGAAGPGAPGAPAADGTGATAAGTPAAPAAPDVSPSAPTLTGLQWPGPVPPPPPGGVTPPPWTPADPYPSGSHPPGTPLPAPGPGAGRRRLWLVVGGAAAVGVTLGLVATLAARSGGDTDERADKPAASASPSPTAGSPEAGPQGQPPSAPDGGGTASAPSPLVGEPPAGYRLFTDPEGFTIIRPEGWSREEVSSKYGIDVVNYYSADRTRRIQVFEVSEASPAESHALFLSDAVQKAPGFTELSLTDGGSGDDSVSRLEYLVDSLTGQPDVGPWHVVDERFTAADGKVYAVAAYGPDAEDRESRRQLLRTALDGFCPPGTTCVGGAG
ncbi:hypothetical protein [Streptomyces sp. bgisy022]|uniref:hypothetical protein n=1 Tax=Streptomyces sp. bgisy022 TaxID=3413769 RepID=UPI003D728E3B